MMIGCKRKHLLLFNPDINAHGIKNSAFDQYEQATPAGITTAMGRFMFAGRNATLTDDPDGCQIGSVLQRRQGIDEFRMTIEGSRSILVFR
jgi:hypothetical protein